MLPAAQLSTVIRWHLLITVPIMVIPARDYSRFLIQGEKQGLLDYFARPRSRTPLAGLEDPQDQGRGLKDSISAEDI